MTLLEKLQQYSPEDTVGAQDCADLITLLWDSMIPTDLPPNWCDVNEVLGQVDVSKMNLTMMLCLARVTCAFSMKLPAWQGYIDRCAAECVARGFEPHGKMQGLVPKPG